MRGVYGRVQESNDSRKKPCAAPPPANIHGALYEHMVQKIGQAGGRLPLHELADIYRNIQAETIRSAFCIAMVEGVETVSLPVEAGGSSAGDGGEDGVDDHGWGKMSPVVGYSDSRMHDNWFDSSTGRYYPKFWKQSVSRGRGSNPHGFRLPPDDSNVSHNAEVLRRIMEKKRYLGEADAGDDISHLDFPERVKDFQRESGEFGLEQWHNFCNDHFRGTSKAGTRDPARVQASYLKEFLEEMERRGCWKGDLAGRSTCPPSPAGSQQSKGSSHGGGSKGHKKGKQGTNFLPGDWYCSSCGYHNYAKNFPFCVKCQQATHPSKGGGGGHKSHKGSSQWADSSRKGPPCSQGGGEWNMGDGDWSTGYSS